MLSKWLFERLKRVRPLSITLDRIKESPVGAVERTFDYLWSRCIEKNLSSIQEGLRKGPKKHGMPAPKFEAKASASTDVVSGCQWYTWER